MRRLRIANCQSSIGNFEWRNMKHKIALLFSGQGAQMVGMGKDLAEQFPAAADLFRNADEVLGRELSRIAWEGPIEALTETANCQPALYVHGLACLRVLCELAGDFPVMAAAGLSLGEWTAHAAAGTFSFEEGLRLVEKRGALMQAACDATDGAMAAMISRLWTGLSSLRIDVEIPPASLTIRYPAATSQGRIPVSQ